MKISHYLFFGLFILILIVLEAFFDGLNIQALQLDKLGHFIGFFTLTWLLHSLVKLPLFNLTVCLMLYAGLTEVSQYYLGFRRGEFRDFIADILGIGVFVVIKYLITTYRNNEKA